MRHARLAAIGTALDASLTAGRLRLYSASRPAQGEVLSTQVLLAEFRLSKPIVQTLEDGVMRFAPIRHVLCHRSGLAAWARLLSGDEEWVADMDVGLPDSGAEVELSTLTLFAGGAVNITLAELSE